MRHQQPNTAPWTPVDNYTEGVQLFERPIPKLESLTLLKAVGEIEGASPADLLRFTLEQLRWSCDTAISGLHVALQRPEQAQGVRSGHSPA